MITTRKLKIWTIICHAFILVGFGHGILFLSVIEILWFPYFTNEDFSFSFSDSFESHLPVIGLTTLLGQLLMLFSLFNLHRGGKIFFQIVGLALLWLSVYYFAYNATRHNSVHIAYFTVIPFAACTLITFFGGVIKRVYAKVLD